MLQLNVQHKRRPLRPCGVRAYLNAGGLVHQGVVRGEVRVHQGHAVPLIHLRVQLGPLAHRGGGTLTQALHLYSASPTHGHSERFTILPHIHPLTRSRTHTEHDRVE